MADINLRFHPNALVVGVTSGKGGVGKSTTAAAVAAALTASGSRTVLADLDVSAPNAHIVGGVGPLEVAADRDTLTLTLPASEHGYTVASPLSIPGVGGVSDVLALVRFVDGVDAVVVDLPGGWTDAHEAFMAMFPHAVVMVAAPTDASAADHARTAKAVVKGYEKAAEDVADADKRRNWAKLMPPAPAMFGFETMARFTGTDEATGRTVTIRRGDVKGEEFLPALMAASGCEFVGSLPGGPVADLAASEVMTGFVARLAGLRQPAAA